MDICIFLLCMCQVVVIIGIVAFVKARKKKYKRRRVIKRLLLIAAVYAVVLLVPRVMRFSSLESSVRFCIGESVNDKNTVKGQKSAFVFPEKEFGMPFFVDNINGKWRAPEHDLEKIKSRRQEDETDGIYVAEVYYAEGENGIYVIIGDQTEGAQWEKTVTDSENSDFLVTQNPLTKCYCTYLKKIPKNYSLEIDGHKIKFDWDWLMKA